MSIRRRLELLDWAKKNNTFIIEDDYNGEFRYDGNPIPSLQSIDKYENVIYLGSISKSLAPFMNISYFVLPDRLISPYNEFYQLYSCHIPWINQYIVQRFIEDGHYEKHIRKIRHMYSKRHNLLLKELSLMSNNIEILNRGAGLYFILRVLNVTSNKWLVEKALDQGVKVISTQSFWQDETLCPQNEVFLGFSLIDLNDINDCVSRLKLAWFN